MSYMQTDGIKIDKHFPKNLGQYLMDGFCSDGTVVLEHAKKVTIGNIYIFLAHN